ncbi:MAG: hypothetical protein LC737_10090, partial [Chloroflexi bacterium]|nr:hypothetical protein [Chloroflexota bacterium]
PYIINALLGLALLPPKGLLVYSPIVLAGVWGMRRFGRQHPREALLIVGVFLSHWLVFGMWRGWLGGFVWGPRFMLPTLPFLVMPIVEVLDSRRGRVLLALLLPVSIAIQVLGAGVTYRDVQGALRSDFPFSVYAPFAHVALFNLSHFDLLWVHHLGSVDEVDWLSAALLLGLIAACVALLSRPRWRWIGTVTAASAVVTLAFLQRNHLDPRVFGGADYRALVFSLSDATTARDVIVVGNHEYTRLFSSEYRGPAKWYALLKPQTMEIPDDEAQLFARLLGKFDRVWLVSDDPPNGRAPRALERWFAPRAFESAQQDFSNYARVLVFDAQPPQLTTALHARFGQIELLGEQYVRSNLEAGRVFRLALFWTTHAPVPQSLTVFVQLLDAQNQVVWQSDRFPSTGFRPTTTWHVDELVPDLY